MSKLDLDERLLDALLGLHVIPSRALDMKQLITSSGPGLPIGSWGTVLGNRLTNGKNAESLPIKVYLAPSGVVKVEIATIIKGPIKACDSFIYVIESVLQLPAALMGNIPNSVTQVPDGQGPKSGSK